MDSETLLVSSIGVKVYQTNKYPQKEIENAGIVMAIKRKP